MAAQICGSNSLLEFFLQAPEMANHISHLRRSGDWRRSVLDHGPKDTGKPHHQYSSDRDRGRTSSRSPPKMEEYAGCTRIKLTFQDGGSFTGISAFRTRPGPEGPPEGAQGGAIAPVAPLGTSLRKKLPSASRILRRGEETPLPGRSPE